VTRWPDWLSATVVEGDSGGVEAAMEGGGGGAGGGGRRRRFFAIAPCKVARAKNRRPLSTAVLYMHVLARHGSRTYSTTCKRAMRSSVGPWWGSSSPTSVGAKLVALKQVLAEEHAAPCRRDGTRDRSYLPWHAEDVWLG